MEALLSAQMPSISGIQNPSATLPDEWVDRAIHPNLGDVTSHPDTVAENDHSSSRSSESAHTGPSAGLGMINLGLEEPLPDQEIIDELHVPQLLVSPSGILLISIGTGSTSKMFTFTCRLYIIIDTWLRWIMLLMPGRQSVSNI